MFTGIVQEIGRISRIDVRGENRRIQISAPRVPAELKTGDSVSVSGVCLTALDIQPASFHADLAPETWRRTSFARLKSGAVVNLELPMRASGRFDGHIVQGHVDLSCARAFLLASLAHIKAAKKIGRAHV